MSSKQQKNLENLMKRLETEPNFKDQLLQEFLDAENDLEIKEKYGLSDYAIKIIRSKYDWGNLIKTSRFSRNWIRDHEKTSNYLALVEKAKNDDVFNKSLLEEFKNNSDDFITTKYNLNPSAGRKICRHFDWSYEVGQARMGNSFEATYGEGVTNASQIPHIAAKKSKRYTAEDGTGLDGAWELEVYNFFTRNGIKVERNIPIKFEYEGKQHTTFIDFKVDDILLEVKGGHLLNGVFSDRLPVPIDKKIELYKENHVIIITNDCSLFGKKDSSESAGLKYPNKCLNPLIGIDINLFINPQFPYRKDRPHCFYEVKVDGKPSAIESFYNESTRWKMIKNRINYMGGFIDSKQILTAMNVTRTSKQPSWFSEKFARDIITKYIRSDIIVDPFAGWGTRHDASIELGKQYIGIDYNKELVDWHKSMGRNIEFGDANLFTYDGDCSVFICPPYTNIEVYFDGQDLGTTQCQWLEIVMKNIPNAREYVMVCKVVDENWTKYIVDTKTNKSHFGVNSEYIIRLTQEEKNKLFNE